MTRKPDRWERMVEQCAIEGGECHPLGLYVAKGSVVELLRREHKAVMRKVKAIQSTYYNHGYQVACTTILAALAKRAR